MLCRQAPARFYPWHVPTQISANHIEAAPTPSHPMSIPASYRLQRRQAKGKHKYQQNMPLRCFNSSANHRPEHAAPSSTNAASIPSTTIHSAGCTSRSTQQSPSKTRQTPSRLPSSKQRYLPAWHMYHLLHHSHQTSPSCIPRHSTKHGQ